jgi:hypothetical protein
MADVSAGRAENLTARSVALMQAKIMPLADISPTRGRRVRRRERLTLGRIVEY